MAQKAFKIKDKIRVNIFDGLVFELFSDTGVIHWSHLISARSCFFESIFDSVLQFSQELSRITKCFIYHMKDLKSEHLILLRKRAWLALKGSHAPEIEPRTVSTKLIR